MAKIIRDNSKITKFNLEEFAHVERGQKPFIMRSFSFEEETSIQDPFDESMDVLPNTILTVDEDDIDIDDDIYLPPSKVAKASDKIKAQKVEFKNLSKPTDIFMESPMFSDDKAVEEEYPKKVISNAEQPQENMQSDATAQARVKVLEELLTQKEDDFKKIKEELENEHAKKIEATREESILEGYNNAKNEIDSEYNTKKDDYIKSIEIFNSGALAKIDELNKSIHNIDDELPRIILGYVKSIIGSERVLNDEFLTNLIKNSIKKLEELKIIEFHVNHDDVELIKAKFPNYQIVADMNIIKGSVNVITKSGEVSINVDDMINDFGKSINEEFRIA